MYMYMYVYIYICIHIYIYIYTHMHTAPDAAICIGSNEKRLHDVDTPVELFYRRDSNRSFASPSADDCLHDGDQEESNDLGRDSSQP